MDLNVGKELAALQRLTVKELRTRYAEVFGEPTNANNRAWIVKRLAWRLQALAEGDLSERARRGANHRPHTRLPAGRPPAAAGDRPHPEVQGRGAAGEGVAARLRVRGGGLRLAQRRRQGHHRLALQWLPVFLLGWPRG